MYFEWRKLIKSKLRIGILVLLLAMPMGILFAGYQDLYDSIRFPVIESVTIMNDGFSSVNQVKLDYVVEDGITYRGLDAIRRQDEIAHEYAGNLADGASENMRDTLEDKLAQLSSSAMIDEEKMTAYYDENWKSYYEKCKKGELTLGEYLDYDHEHTATLRSFEQDEEILPLTSFQTFYTDAYTLESASLKMLYEYPLYEEEYHQEDDLITKEKLAYLEEYERLKTLHPTERVEMEGEWPRIFYHSSEENYSDDKIAYLNTEFMKHPMKLEGMKAYSLMTSCMEALAKAMPWILLLFGVFFASLFNQEYKHKTDQLLRGMWIGNGAQAKAKIKLCFLIMMGYSVIVLFLIWVVPHILIGYHSLDGFSRWIWSYQEEMIMISFLFLFAMLLYCGILCLLSACVKSMFSAFLLFVVCIGIGCMEQFATFPFMTSSFLSCLPCSSFTADFYPLMVYPFLGMFVQKGYVLLIMYAGIGLLCTWIAYQYYRKKDVQNA